MGPAGCGTALLKLKRSQSRQGTDYCAETATRFCRPGNSTVRNNAHLKKETTVRTEFGGAHHRGTLAGSFIEGKTFKGAHLNLPALRLAGNLDDFPLHLE